MKKAAYAAFMVAAIGLTSCGGSEETEVVVVDEVTSSEYTLNAEETKLEWRAAWVIPAEDASLTEDEHHTGTIKITDGSVTSTGDDIVGDFNIDLTSIEVTDLEPEEGKGSLEAHLMGKKEDKDPNHFFNTNEFTTAKVHLKEIVDGMAHVVLSVMGIEIEQKVTISTSTEGDKMMMHGEFPMDFTALNWRMAAPNPEKPEGGNVSPVVNFHLHAVLDKK